MAQLVDRLSDQFLAGAGFAKHQHRQIVAQDSRYHAIDDLHRRASTNQGQALACRSHVFGCALAAFGGLAGGLDQLIEVERLWKILESPGVAGANCGIERVLRRKDDDRHVGMSRTDLAQSLDPVSVRQHDVGQHDVIAVLAQQPVAIGD